MFKDLQVTLIRRIQMLRTLPLSKYCEISGESQKAIERRIERGYWVQGKQFFTVAHVRERWVDLEGVEAWVRAGGSMV